MIYPVFSSTNPKLPEETIKKLFKAMALKESKVWPFMCASDENKIFVKSNNKGGVKDLIHNTVIGIYKTCELANLMGVTIQGIHQMRYKNVFPFSEKFGTPRGTRKAYRKDLKVKYYTREFYILPEHIEVVDRVIEKFNREIDKIKPYKRRMK